MPPNFAASAGQRDQLFGCGVGRGRILQRGGDADRAILHGLAHQRLHLLELARGGRAIVIAQHHAPHLRGADVSSQIDAHALLFQAREVLPQRAPVRRDLQVIVGDAGRP